MSVSLRWVWSRTIARRANSPRFVDRLAVAAMAVAAVGLPSVPLPAQLTAQDSTAIASAIASAVRTRIADTGANRGAKMDPRPTSAFASAEWNRLVGAALRAMDAALVPAAPTALTMSLNIVSVAAAGDSAMVRVAITQCRETARGLVFGGTGYDYVFRRAGTAWRYERDTVRGHGDGRCAS